jgi:hypothetical protein
MSDEEDRLTEAARLLHQDGKSLEAILTYLRTESNSKVLAIIVIARVIKMSLEDAKLLVHESKTWQDVKKRDEEFHEKINSAMEKMEKKKSRSK